MYLEIRFWGFWDISTTERFFCINHNVELFFRRRMIIRLFFIILMISFVLQKNHITFVSIRAKGGTNFSSSLRLKKEGWWYQVSNYPGIRHFYLPSTAAQEGLSAGCQRYHPSSFCRQRAPMILRGIRHFKVFLALASFACATPTELKMPVYVFLPFTSAPCFEKTFFLPPLVSLSFSAKKSTCSVPSSPFLSLFSVKRPRHHKRFGARKKPR